MANVMLACIVPGRLAQLSSVALPAREQFNCTAGTVAAKYDSPFGLLAGTC